jgi:choline-sulfatase
MYKDADMPLPDYGDGMEEHYSDFDRAFLRWYGLDRAPLTDPVKVLQARRAFAALSHYIDDKLGELLDVLEEQGLRENTAVIFTADHGEMLGEKGLIQKRSFYEWSARIPLVIDMPGAGPGQAETPVSLLDLPATLLELAGQEPVRPMDGRSLLPALNGGELEEVPVIAEYHGEGIMRPSFMVRLGCWKMIYCHGFPHQLFNLAEDPEEKVNRAGDPAAAEPEARLLQEITGGRFDLEAIEAEVRARLPQKQLVNAAMAASGTHWDYLPDQDVQTRYVRS